ncbi:MAG: N-6 DNA methylase [Treponema sp.]|nr:N-6 DNA methylase [Treponema sp.]
MSYAKHFYVDRALQNFNFAAGETGRIETLVIAFAAYVAKKHKLDLSLSIPEILAFKDVPPAVKEFSGARDFRFDKSNLQTFEKVSSEDIRNYITDKIEFWGERISINSGLITSPSAINYLSAKALDIQPGNTVLDLGAGYSSFLIHVGKNYKCKNLVGVEIDRATLIFGSMLSYLEDVTLSLIPGDALLLDTKKKYDRIYCFPPFIENVGVFIQKVLSLLCENGRAVVFLPMGFLFDNHKNFKECRKFLVEKGFIETVIELASGVLLPLTAAHTTLLVLSKKNKNTKIVNASSIHENTRRGVSVLTEECADKIFDLLKKENEDSVTLSIEQIREKDFNLVSSTYLLEEKIKLAGVKKYAKLADLVETKILRGAQIKASELEKLGSNEDTGLYYAFAKDIKDNQLSQELKALKAVDEKSQAVALKEGDLLLVMVLSETLKLACVQNIGDKKIIPASNMYIIRLDKTKIEPLYLKMLLETEKAYQIINAFTVGTTIRSISIDFLNRLQIPLPSLEVQKSLVNKYKEIEDECESLKKRLEALTTEKGRIITSHF